MKGALFALGLLLAASAAPAAEPAKPLFADDQLIHVTIRGPINRLASSEDRSRIVAGTLSTGSETCRSNCPLAASLGCARKPASFRRCVSTSPVRRPPARCSPASGA
jgi:hypothetical protein